MCRVESPTGTHTVTVIWLRSPMTPASAAFPYTTECSPFRMTFPGADTVNVSAIIFFFWIPKRTEYDSKWNLIFFSWWFILWLIFIQNMIELQWAMIYLLTSTHCCGVKVFCENAWMVFSSSARAALTKRWRCKMDFPSNSGETMIVLNLPPQPSDSSITSCNGNWPRKKTFKFKHENTDISLCLVIKYEYLSVGWHAFRIE